MFNHPGHDFSSGFRLDAAQGGGGVTITGAVPEMWTCGTEGCGQWDGLRLGSGGAQQCEELSHGWLIGPRVTKGLC